MISLSQTEHQELIEEWTLDHVDKWHEMPEDNQPLHEYLGMTWTECKQWVENPDLFPEHLYNMIVNEDRKSKEL